MRNLSTDLDLRMLRQKKIFFIDRDGTLSLEDRLLPGAFSLINLLLEQELPFYILTNNSSRTPREHWSRFVKMGLLIKEEHVLVSLQSALSDLLERGFRQIYWVANNSVGRYIAGQGFTLSHHRPQAVLLTYDDELSYSRLRWLCRLVRRELPYYATHSDLVCPAREGPIPDIGTFIKVVEMTTGRKPDRVFGKPSRMTIQHVLTRHGMDFKDAVIVGDRLYTDIRMARGSALTSVLVLSGETNENDLEQTDDLPDYVVEDVGELARVLSVGGDKG